MEPLKLECIEHPEITVNIDKEHKVSYKKHKKLKDTVDEPNNPHLFYHYLLEPDVFNDIDSEDLKKVIDSYFNYEISYEEYMSRIRRNISSRYPQRFRDVSLTIITRMTEFSKENIEMLLAVYNHNIGSLPTPTSLDHSLTIKYQASFDSNKEGVEIIFLEEVKCIEKEKEVEFVYNPHEAPPTPKPKLYAGGSFIPTLSPPSTTIKLTKKELGKGEFHKLKNPVSTPKD